MNSSNKNNIPNRPARKNTANRISPSKTKKTVHKNYKRKSSPVKKKRKIVFLILLLTLYFIINLLIAGFIYFSFNNNSNNAELYSVKICLDEERLYSFEPKEVNNAYGLYVPFQKLCSICDFTIVGDSENINILVRPSGDAVKCKNNSSLIYVNDNAVRLSSPILFQSNDYLIPIELIETYIVGVDVEYNEDKYLCSISRKSEDNVELKILLPNELEKTYFPKEYKVIPEESAAESSDTSSDISLDTSEAAQ